MRGLIILLFVGAATCIPQGYNYQQPLTHTEAIPRNGFSENYQGAASSPAALHSGLNSIPGASSSGGQHGLGGAGTVTKNFFIHSAPEESDDDILADGQSAVANKKYNIVFVKAPAQSAKSAALALRKAQSEEKTLIYVLNKNLDASDFQAALQGTPTEPTKPEVVFIKYKTPEEAAHAQQQIQQQYEALGSGPSFVANEEVAPVSSVIGSLGSSGGNAGFAHGGGFNRGGSIGDSSSHAATSYLPPRVL